MQQVRGKLVQKRRREVDMSQEELADAVGTTQQTISRVEAGVFEPRDYLKGRIASELGVKVRVLFPHVDEVGEVEE